MPIFMPIDPVPSPTPTTNRSDPQPCRIFELVVHTRWCPPRHDEDGYLCQKVNHFDRDLVILSSTHGNKTLANLLDLISVSVDGRGIKVETRSQPSPAGRAFLDFIARRMPGSPTSTCSPRLMRIKVAEADQERFVLGRPCDIKLYLIGGGA